MSFTDTLKDVLDQGIQVSKEIAEKAGRKTKEFGKETLEASANFAVKAGAKVQEFGEKGVLMVEVKQMEAQVKKLIGSLGALTYSALDKDTPLDLSDPEIKKLFDEITSLRDAIEFREAELKAKR
jgi:capsule polysaccharide export protein KpsE/RkpR